jgi:hypothetical protein
MTMRVPLGAIIPKFPVSFHPICYHPVVKVSLTCSIMMVMYRSYEGLEAAPVRRYGSERLALDTGFCDMADAIENNNDLPAHIDSYGRFITWFKNAAIGVVIIVAIVVTIIVVNR